MCYCDGPMFRLTGLCLVEPLEIVSAMLACFPVAKAGHDTPLSRLATNMGE